MWAHLTTTRRRCARTPRTRRPSWTRSSTRALAKEPDDRYQSAGDLGGAPRSRRSAATRACEATASSRAARRRPRRPKPRRRPDQAPTVLADPGPRRAGRRPAWVWALARGSGPRGRRRRGHRPARRRGDGTPASSSTATTRRRRPRATRSRSRRPRRADDQVGSRPNAVVVAGGLVWVLRARSDRLATLRLSGAARRTARGSGALPAAAASLSGRLWVGVQRDSTLVSVGLKSHKVIGSPIPIPSLRGKIVGSRRASAASGSASAAPGFATRVSPTRRQIVAQVVMPDGVQDLAVGAGAVWVLGRRSNTVTRVDVASGEKRVINVGKDPAGVAVGAGAVWVTNSGDYTVTRIDQGSLVTRVIGVGDGPNRIAVGGGAVWVANRNDSTLTRIDAENLPAGRRPHRGRREPVRARRRGPPGLGHEPAGRDRPADRLLAQAVAGHGVAVAVATGPVARRRRLVTLDLRSDGLAGNASSRRRSGCWTADPCGWAPSGYTNENGSRGLATLLCAHVRVPQVADRAEIPRPRAARTGNRKSTTPTLPPWCGPP